MIPDRQTCERIWSEQQISEELREHLAAVAEFSVRVGTALNKRGYQLDIPRIEAAALLHDIKKGKPHHAEAGSKMLKTLGFPEIAPIVEGHMRLPYNFCPEINELTIVFLADKLFIGSEFVTLAKRYSERLLTCRDNPLVIEIINHQFQMALNLQNIIEDALGAEAPELFNQNGEGL